MLARWSSLLADMQDVEQADLPPSLKTLCTNMLLQVATVHTNLQTALGDRTVELAAVASLLETIGNAYVDMADSINLHQYQQDGDGNAFRSSGIVHKDR